MRNTFIIFIGLIIFGCSASGQQPDENDIQGFNDFLGKEKAIALDAAVESFEQFLLTNYAKHTSHASRTKAFLEQIENKYESHSSWALATKDNIKIIEAFESSGLRKEIWIYDNEEYEPEYNIYELLSPEKPDSSNIRDLGELDSISIEDEFVPLSNNDSVENAKREQEMEERFKKSLHTNPFGEFLYGLTKFTPKDSHFQEYVDAKVMIGDISSVILATAFLEQDINFDDPFMKRIIVVEFYFWIMKWDIELRE